MALQLSDEERERRRQRALAMHAERHPDDPNRRRFGGPQPGSGPKKQRRATEVAAERIAREGALMADAVIDAMGAHQPASIRLQGVRLAAELEHREAELQLREDRSIDDMGTKDVLEMLVGMSMRAVRSGQLNVQFGPEIIEGSVVEVQNGSG